MSAIVVDTSSWISYFAGKHDAVLLENALSLGNVFVPPIVAAELLSGTFTLKKRADLEEVLRILPWCNTDQDHWIRVGNLRSYLRSHGITLSTPDTHVAQCALDYNALLLTEDHVFDRIVKYVPLRIIHSD